LATFHQARAAGDAQFRLTDVYGHYWEQWLESGTDLYLGFYYNNSFKGRFSYSNGVYTKVSDLRFKSDIRLMEDVLSQVRLLNPVSYVMTTHNPGQKLSTGFIAQEVKEIFPGLVKVVDDHARKGVHHKDLHTMNYSTLNVIAVKALQEQYAELKLLEEENAALMERAKILLNKVKGE
jgi:hypothetical protein